MRHPIVPRHWTPRYVLDRSQLALYQRRHADDPWLTADAIGFLTQWLRPADQCLEWGSGRSTVWLAARTAGVTSIEHDPSWAARVSQQLAPSEHATVHLVTDDVDTYASGPALPNAIDLALVDGIHRDACAIEATDRVVPGGLVAIDNVERYLPSSSRAPEAIGDRHASGLWQEFAHRTADWRRYWTSNGVTDTAFFFKPC